MPGGSDLKERQLGACVRAAISSPPSPLSTDVVSQVRSLSSRWSSPVPLTVPVVVSAGEESILAGVIRGLHQGLHDAPRMSLALAMKLMNTFVRNMCSSKEYFCITEMKECLKVQPLSISRSFLLICFLLKKAHDSARE
ncbi:RNA-binding protein 43 isoform X2 [Monodon monoceros]|uniref:RNA-binding protein 43 isoform X2 n=1 Tax=Monodon monoceros TaxID=40151 RepID=UPI0010F63453|nr:RNA-binding protein 43 isoform X2 [Monodon monoceros]XP_029080910.1 RNA-binding protein 43 isoform X2 [Monodon monoceros]